MALTFDNKSIAQLAMIAAGAATSIIGLLALKYNDRALFYEHRAGIPPMAGEPLIGSLGLQLRNKSWLHDYLMFTMERLNTLTA